MRLSHRMPHTRSWTDLKPCERLCRPLAASTLTADSVTYSSHTLALPLARLSTMHPDSIRLCLCSITYSDAVCHAHSTQPNIFYFVVMLFVARPTRNPLFTHLMLFSCSLPRTLRVTQRLLLSLPHSSRAAQMGVFGAHGLAPRNNLWCTGPSPCTAEDLPL